jgi:hypothetical protein
MIDFYICFAPVNHDWSLGQLSARPPAAREGLVSKTEIPKLNLM